MVILQKTPLIGDGRAKGNLVQIEMPLKKLIATPKFPFRLFQDGDNHQQKYCAFAFPLEGSQDFPRQSQKYTPFHHEIISFLQGFIRRSIRRRSLF